MRRTSALLAALAASATLAACGDDSPEPVRLPDPAQTETTGSDELGGSFADEGDAGGERKRSGGGKPDRSGESGADAGSGGSRSGSGSGGASAGSGEGGSGGGSESGGGDSGGGSGKAFTPADVQAGNDQAEALARELEEAKGAVRRIIDSINRADGSVCAELFTQRYVESRTGLKGDAAVAKCRLDVGRSRGRVQLTAFGPSRLDNDRATIKFNLRAGETLTAEEYHMLRGPDGRWRLDQAR